MENKNSSGIYAIVNKVNSHCYVGQAKSFSMRWSTHTAQLKAGRHHCMPLQRAWEKYGSDSFFFKVIELTSPDKATLTLREQFWIDLIDPAYNVNRVALPGWHGMKHTAEAKQKISDFHKHNEAAKAHRAKLHAAKRGVPRTAEVKEKMRAARIGKKHSPESLERIRANAKMRVGVPMSPAAREKISAGLRLVEFVMTDRRQEMYESRRGKPISEAHRAALLKSLIGRKVSDETRAKIGAANRIKRLGKKHSAETKAKIGLAHIGKKRPDVTLLLKGVPRPPHVVQALKAGNERRWADTVAKIKAALIEYPTMSATKIAALINVNRDTVTKYRRLLCQQPQQNDSASDGGASPSQQDLWSTSP